MRALQWRRGGLTIENERAPPKKPGISVATTKARPNTNNQATSHPLMVG